MGFGLGKIGGAIKKAFGGGGSLFGNITGGLNSFASWLDVTKPGGLGDILTFGSISQAEAAKQAKKAKNMAGQQYAAEVDALKAAASETERLEAEKRKRLIAAGQKNPDTLYSGYTGLPGSANVIRNFLG